MRLIDADAFEQWLLKSQKNANESGRYEGDVDDDIERPLYYSTQSFIDTMRHRPTVDAKPTRYGHWIASGPDWVCSWCGTEFKKDELEFIEGAGDYYMPHYCPHCGAEMDLEEETE